MVSQSKFVRFCVNGLALIVGVFLISFFFIRHFENRKIWGDEWAYIRVSHQQVEKVPPFLSVLPGQLKLYWWPPLPFSVYSFFANERLVRHYNGIEHLEAEEFEAEREKFIRKVSFFNAALLVFSGCLIYLIAGEVGLKGGFSVLAASLTVFNPRILFYVQALWPELLHFTLILSATYLFIRFFAKQQRALLFASSLIYGYCVFTKGIVSHYYWFLVIVLAVFARKLQVREAVIALLIFVLPYSSVVGVQRLVNLRRDGTSAISLNTWINIEAGLIPTSKIREDGYEDVYDRYFSVSQDPVQRELESRRRVLEYIREVPVREIIIHQTRQYSALMNNSFLQLGIKEQRWANSGDIVLLGIISVFLSWGLFVLGGIGAVMFLRQGSRMLVLSGYTLYYLAALYVVGFNARFFSQAIPFLSIFTAKVLQELVFSSVARGVRTPTSVSR